MLAYIARRLAFLLLVVLGTIVLIFAMSYVAPADPARAALGLYATQEAVEQYRRERGLDQPIPVQFLVYLQHVLQGDLGTSILTGRPVVDEFAEAVPATIELLVPSLVLSTVVGLALGMIGAVRRNSLADAASRVIAVFGMSMPVFWFGVVLQIAFFLWLGWLPFGRRLDPAEIAPPAVTGLITVDSLIAGDISLFISAVKHLILPVLCLSLLSVAEMTRMTRSALLDVLGQDYILVARSKGLSGRSVLFGHALKNALIPLVTVLGLQIGRALGGAVIVETIFSWPGIGRQVVNALIKLDLPMVAAYGMLVSLAYGLANLLVDLSYTLIDPRIRYR
jgi:peptide/nickel transport system permease protein